MKFAVVGGGGGGGGGACASLLKPSILTLSIQRTFLLCNLLKLFSLRRGAVKFRDSYYTQNRTGLRHSHHLMHFQQRAFLDPAN